ncbi:MAG: hypothetical protein C4341_00885 [Armatimonadota bacterium]
MLRFLTGIAFGAGLAAGAILLQSSERSLYVNGAKARLPARVEGEEVYIPGSALKAAGAGVMVSEERVSLQFVPLKGMEEQQYVDGIIGEYVSNEEWRFKVVSIHEIADPFTGRGKGLAVTLEVRNLRSDSASLLGTGLDIVQVLDARQNRMSLADSSFRDRYSRIQPGGSFTNVLRFGSAPAGFGEPAKLIIQFRGSGGRKALKPIRINLRPER